jgi:hypothetical protein
MGVGSVLTGMFSGLSAKRLYKAWQGRENSG